MSAEVAYEEEGGSFPKDNHLTANSKLNGGCSKEMAAQSGYWETH